MAVTLTQPQTERRQQKSAATSLLPLFPRLPSQFSYPLPSLPMSRAKSTEALARQITFFSFCVCSYPFLGRVLQSLFCEALGPLAVSFGGPVLAASPRLTTASQTGSRASANERQ